MSALREKLLAIVASYATGDTAGLADAKSLRELPVDSVGMLGVLDEIEDEFGIKIGEGLQPETTIDDFEALVAGLIAARDA